MKKLFILVIAIFLVGMPVIAQEKIKEIANISQDFTLNDIPEEIEFTSNKEMIFGNIIIPRNAVVVNEVLGVQKERRWHKSGFILLCAKYYETEEGNKVDLLDKDIYLVARKYEKIDKKEAAITGTEIVLSSAASFVIPGIDVAYYFTKGAIKRDKNGNWFKSGVSTAYDNSIFWFWLKGKPIELNENETISIKSVDEMKAQELKYKIEKQKRKEAAE